MSGPRRLGMAGPSGEGGANPVRAGGGPLIERPAAEETDPVRNRAAIRGISLLSAEAAREIGG